jgi:hypothetical protein
MWQRATRMWRRQHLVVGAVVLALGAAVYLLAMGGDFYQDDFLNARIANDMGLTRQYLLLNIFNHFAPAMRLTDWAAMRYLPFDYHATLVVSVVVYMLTLLALYRVLRALVGPNPWIPLLVLLFGVSPLWTVSVMWWAGVNALAANLFVIVALDGYVRYRRRQDVLHLLECVLAFALALLFYEKGILVLLYAGLLELLVISRLSLRDVLRGWPVWLGMAVVAAAFVGVYLHGHYLQSGTHPSARTLLHFVGLAWAGGLIPSVLGGPLDWQWAFSGTALGRVGPPTWLGVVDQLVVLGVVVAGFVRSRDAWRGWLFLAIGFLGSVGIVGWGRIADMGIAAAQDTRYLFDGMFLVFVAVAVVFLRPLDRAEVGPAGAVEPLRSTRGRVLGACTAVGGALVVLGAAASWQPASAHWTGSDATHFMHRVRAVLPGMSGASFYDLTVPESLVIHQFYPYSKYSTVLWFVNRGARFNVPDTPGYVLDDQGTLHRAELQHVAWTDVRAGGAARCSGGDGVVDLRLDQTSGEGTWFLHFRADTAAVLTLQVLVAGNGGWVVGTAAPLALEGGTHEYVVDLVPGELSGVRLLAPSGSRLCVGAAELVRPVPVTTR